MFLIGMSMKYLGSKKAVLFCEQRMLLEWIFWKVLGWVCKLSASMDNRNPRRTRPCIKLGISIIRSMTGTYLALSECHKNGWHPSIHWHGCMDGWMGWMHGCMEGIEWMKERGRDGNTMVIFPPSGRSQNHCFWYLWLFWLNKPPYVSEAPNLLDI